MKVYETENIRNAAVVGHGDTGKTTLISALLYRAGATGHLGHISEKNTVTDFEEEEQERGITLATTPAWCEWEGTKINFLDTPGFSNFVADARSGLKVADTALIVVSGVEGVQVQTSRLWDWAIEFDLPRVFAVNLIDRERANFAKAVTSIQENFGKTAVPVGIPWGSGETMRGIIDLVRMKAYEHPKDASGKGKETGIPDDMKDDVAKYRKILVEGIAELDDALMEKYFEEEDLSQEEILKGLKDGFKHGKIFPILPTSALLNIGSARVLDFIAKVSPSPVVHEGYDATKGEEAITLKADPGAPVSAYVFKSFSDAYSGKINIFKVISGTLKGDDTLMNTTKKEKEKISTILLMQGKEHLNVPEVHAGDIAGTAKLRHTDTSDTLSDTAHPVVVKPVVYPEPIISFAVSGNSRTDEEKIANTLKKLAEVDPLLKSYRDQRTNDLLVAGTGQLHVEVALAKVKRLVNVDVILHPPKVPYFETIRKKSTARYRHKKQSGGHGQFAECEIRLEPIGRGEDFEFKSEIFGASIPSNYLPAVEKGVEETRQKGFIAGYPVVDFRVIVLDGKHHEVDSSEMAFKIASSRAFKQAMDGADPVMLEPIMNVEITAPEECTGDIMGDLNTRRGRVQGMDTVAKTQSIRAQVPLSEMLSYAATLKSVTSDRGLFHMEFSHYDETPRSIQDKIVKDISVDKKEEEED